MPGLTMVIILLMTAVLAALLVDYMGVFGFLLVILVAAIGHAIEKSREFRE